MARSLFLFVVAAGAGAAAVLGALAFLHGAGSSPAGAEAATPGPYRHRSEQAPPRRA